MDRFCHRCAGELSGASGESTFCPHCGAPQLRVLEENVSATLSAAADSTGTLPPPHPGLVDWRAAVAYAALVAFVATALMVGVLWFPTAFPFAWLWTVCGAVLVLGIYQRRHPETTVNAGIGARMGLVYGLLAVVDLTAAAAAAGIVARFSLHRMGGIDTWLTAAMHQALQQQMQQSPGAIVLSDDQLRIFFSPELRAGLALFLLSVAAAFLVAFSALGGALGGLMRTRRR